MEGNTELQEPSQQLNPEIRNLEEIKVNWIRSLKNRFNRVFQKEQESGEPKISVNIFYSAHRTARDTKGLEEEFRRADIYIPEAFGWDNNALAKYRKVSKGTITPEKALADHSAKDQDSSYKRAIYELVYNSKKPITFIDLPLDNDSQSALIRYILPPMYKFGHNFESVLNSEREHIERFAALQREREEYMVDNLKPQIHKLLKAYPELRNKQQINILLSVGTRDTAVYHSLKKDYPSSTRVFAIMPLIYSFAEEAERAYGMNRQVDNQLVANVCMESCLRTAYYYLRLLFPDRQKEKRLLRGLISRFSFDEIKNMFESVHDLEEWQVLFEQELSKKGLKIPESENELDEFLAKPISSSPKSPEQKS